MSKVISDIRKILLSRKSYDISQYDGLFIANSVNNRISYLQLNSISEYLSLIEESDQEPDLLIGTLNNVYSEFFRNPLLFNFIEQFILPGILRDDREHPKEIRIWSAGCASGQEAYSLAIIVRECMRNIQVDREVRIFATDKSLKEIENAKKGIYHFNSVKNSSHGIIKKYFSESGEMYSVKPDLKSHVNFSVFDLADENFTSPPESIFGFFDIIMCSNLLFYYKTEIRNEIIAKLLRSLPKNRFIITGEAEVSYFDQIQGIKQCSPLVPAFLKLN